MDLDESVGGNGAAGGAAGGRLSGNGGNGAGGSTGGGGGSASSEQQLAAGDIDSRRGEGGRGGHILISETGEREHVHLAGDARMLQELMKIKNQVKLLSHCCYVLRAQVLRLNQSIPVTTKRVYLAAHRAIASQTQQRRSLQGRLDKLVRLFN